MDTIDFGLPNIDKKPASWDSHIIKVIGVGGGGNNAVAMMYNDGFRDVRFEICNTDFTALEDNPVPVRRQLGADGLGVGGDPEKGRKLAEENIDEIHKMFDDGTRMLFITAGMGGGTGTGVSPVIAREARKAGILTVGVVTIPFKFERNKRIDRALDGLQVLSANVDSLLVVNNDRLQDICPFNTFKAALKISDHILYDAVKSISDIIKTHMKINQAFNDVCNVLKDGGIALIGYGEAEGENRVQEALRKAVNSPLLNDNDIFNAKKMLMSIYTSDDDDDTLTMQETRDISAFMDRFKDDDIDTKFGIAYMPDMGRKVKIIILASGFGLRTQKFMAPNMRKDNADVADEEQSTIDPEGRRPAFYDTASFRNVRNIFTFDDSDLDNDNIIDAVAASDTKTRKYNTLRSIVRASARNLKTISFVGA